MNDIIKLCAFLPRQDAIISEMEFSLTRLRSRRRDLWCRDITRVCVYLCFSASYCMLSINDDVWWNVSFVQGDEGPLGPPGNAGPMVGTSTFKYSVRTNVHVCTNGVLLQLGVKLLQGSNSDKHRKKPHYELWIRLFVTLPPFFCRGGLEGKATSVNLVLTVWRWVLFHIIILRLLLKYTHIPEELLLLR